MNKRHAMLTSAVAYNVVPQAVLVNSVYTSKYEVMYIRKKKAVQSNKKLLVIVGIIFAASIVGATGYLLGETANAPEAEETSIASSSKIVTGNASADTTAEQLNYLIEEEKLAHDAHTKMYERYGTIHHTYQL